MAGTEAEWEGDSEKDVSYTSEADQVETPTKYVGHRATSDSLTRAYETRLRQPEQNRRRDERMRARCNWEKWTHGGSGGLKIVDIGQLLAGMTR